MAAVIRRGSNCRLKFKVMGNVDLTAMGTPIIAISQDYAFLVLAEDQVTVDAEKNIVYGNMSEADTMALTENAKTTCQLTFTDEETENVIRLPIHELTVEGTILGNLL